MTAVPTIKSMRPEPARDQYGRYLLTDPRTGKRRPFTRSTTQAHTLDDTFGLTQWKRRMVLQGAATNPLLLSDVGSLVQEIENAADWRDAKAATQALDALCDAAAREAGAEDGSAWGTLLHTITEYFDAGRWADIADQVPEDLLGDLGAYVEAMAKANITCPPEYIERIVVNTRTETAGTFDRLLLMPDGRLVVGDLKTQKSVEYGWLAIAMQLAQYAQADAMVDPETGELGPMPDTLDLTRGVVMHLPVGQGRCDLYEIDLEQGWRAALLASDVREFRQSSKRMGWPLATAGTRHVSVADARGFTLPAPAPFTMADWAPARDRYLVTNAGHPDALVALWRDLSASGRWTDELTTLAAARKKELAQ
jgi:hypothetical protein